MTPRARTVVIAVAALVVGAVAGGVAGGYAAIRFTAAFFGDGDMLERAVDVQARVAVLQHLRRGEKERAIELLEFGLDGEVIGLRLDGESAERIREAVGVAIARARDYRAVYPRSTHHPEVDIAVSNVLDSATAGR